MVFWFSQTRWGQNMLGIPYRFDSAQSQARRHPHRAQSVSLPIAADTHTHLRILLSESGLTPSMVLHTRRGWSVGSKLMASAAALVLFAGVILTLLAVNADTANMHTYRPVIFTILGVLFIVIGPVVACRMVLNAYDRRLADEQRQYEQLARTMRSRGNAQEARPRNRALMAVDYLLEAAGLRTHTSPQRDLSHIFPDALPSYASALDLQEHKHWASKFFDYKRDPPPPYGEALQMRTFRFEERQIRDSDPTVESDQGSNESVNVPGAGPPAYSQIVDVQVLPPPFEQQQGQLEQEVEPLNNINNNNNNNNTSTD